jgi:hypothetical protein
VQPISNGLGDDDQRQVLHRRLQQQLARIAAHRNALAAALRASEHARLSRTALHLVTEGDSVFVNDIIVGISSHERFSLTN